MRSPSPSNAVFGLILFSCSSSALMPRAQLPPSFSVSTYAGKATGFPNVDRDGGGGGVLNGKNVLIFSDTITTNDAGAMVNFSSNSYAFVPNAKEPTKMQDVGSTSRPDVPAELVPWWGAEKCQTNFIWPNSKSIFAMPIVDVANYSRSFYNQVQRSDRKSGLCYLRRWLALSSTGANTILSSR